jgi:hypothetical protein
MPFVIQIDAWDTVAAAAVTLRLSSVDDERVCHVNGQTWLPAIDALPTLAMDFFGGEFGVVSTPRSTFTMMTGDWPNFGRYAFVDARMQMWQGDAGAAWGGYVLRFDGRISADPEIEDQRATLSFGVDDRWLDQPLLATYAGTGGIEGRAEQKGAEKPLALGAPQGVPGVLLDPVKWIYQLHAYGAVESVDVPLERLARQFGSPVADHANYAALDAATVAAGQWATCKASGLVRMGAPPYGKLCFLMRGDKGGVDGWVRRAGAQIKRIAAIAGYAAKVNEASVDALDAARPYDLSLYFGSQQSVREAVQAIAASVNAVAGVSLTGELITVAIGINAAALTLQVDGSGDPSVASCRKLGMDAPWWRLSIGAQPFWLVHGDGDYVTATSPASGATNDGDPNILTVAQKIALVTSEAAREAEYTDWSGRATTLGTSALTTALGTLNTKRTAWLALRNAISPAWNDSSTTSTITRSAYTTATSEYDDQLSNLRLLISEDSTIRAAAAQAAADAAQTSANTANAALLDIASDSILTPDEKPSVILNRDVIIAEQGGIDTQAAGFGITTERTAYNTAITTLTTYLATLTTPVLWSNLSGNTAIVGATFRTRFADVYTARQALLNKIAAEASLRANWANVTGPGTPDTNATVSDNFIKNADLSQGIVFWSYNPANTSRQTGVSGVANEPPYYWRMTSTAADIRANDGTLIPVSGGSRLYLSFAGRCAGGVAGYFQFTIWEYDNAGGLIGTIPIYVTPAGTAWESRSTAVTLNANTARILLQTGCGAGIGAFADIGAFRLSNTERNASVPVQVSIVGGQDKTIAADYLGAVTGSYPVFAPTVLRNGVSIKTDTYTTYAVTKVSDGTTGADGGTISLDNTGGSSSKGNVTPSGFATGSTQIKWQLETKANGVTVDRTVCTLTKSLASPPVSGGGGGGGGSSSASMPANATISSNTTYASLSTSAAQKVTLATGQTLRCTLVAEYDAGSSSGSRALTAKARYASNSSMTSPTDFGSAVTGTGAFPAREVGGEWFDPVAGSLTFSQTVTGLVAGDYWVDMQGITTASGKSIFMGGENIIIEAY